MSQQQPGTSEVMSSMNAVYKTIYNNQQQMQEVFRKQQQRETFFKQTLIKSHHTFGNTIFKTRKAQYFDHLKKDRYKTRHLLLREVHRSLRGTITRQQKEKEVRDLAMNNGGHGVNEVNMISAYPDTSVPVESQHIIQTLTEMANEDIANDVGHLSRQDMLDRVMNHHVKTEQSVAALKNKGEENFTAKDKLANILDRKFLTAFEVEDVAQYDVQVQTIFYLMKGDVKAYFTAQQFKKVFDHANPEGYLADVALRFVSKFYDQKQSGVSPPVPNLGNYSLEQRHSGQGDSMFKLLCFALSQSDRDNYIKLREGSITLPQLLARVQEQRTGRRFVVLDDLKPDLHPSILKKPDRYLMAAQQEIELEDQLRLHAQQRGVNQEELKRTAKAISRDPRCIKSIYNHLTKHKRDQSDGLNLKQHLINQKEVKDRYQTQVQEKQTQAEKAYTDKWEAVEKRKRMRTESKLQMTLEEEQMQQIHAQKMAKGMDPEQKQQIVDVYRKEQEYLQEQKSEQKTNRRSARLHFGKKENPVEQIEYLQTRLDQDKDLQFLIRLAEYRNEQTDPSSCVLLTKFKKIEEILQTGQISNPSHETRHTEESKVELQPSVSKTQATVFSKLVPSGKSKIRFNNKSGKHADVKVGLDTSYLTSKELNNEHETIEHPPSQKQGMVYDNLNESSCENHLITPIVYQKDVHQIINYNLEEHLLEMNEQLTPDERKDTQKSYLKATFVQHRPKSSIQLGGGAKSYQIRPKNTSELQRPKLESNAKGPFDFACQHQRYESETKQTVIKSLFKPKTGSRKQNFNNDFKRSLNTTIDTQDGSRQLTVTQFLKPKPSQVPASVIDWYNNNIGSSVTDKSTIDINFMSQAKCASRGVKQGHFGAVNDYASSRIPFKKMIGLQDSFGKTDLSVGTIIGDDLIQASTRNAETQEDFIQTGSFEDRISGFNWLTGTQMNIYNHERLTYLSTIEKRPRFTQPVLKKQKQQTGVSQGNQVSEEYIK